MTEEDRFWEAFYFDADQERMQQWYEAERLPIKCLICNDYHRPEDNGNDCD